MPVIREVRNHDFIADLYGLDSLPDLGHHPHCFVPHCPWGCRATEFATEGVQVCATDRGPSDTEDCIGGLFDLGFGDGGNGHVEGLAFPEDCAHGVVVVMIIVVVVVIVIEVSSRHSRLNKKLDCGSGWISVFDESIKVLR